MKYPAYPKYKDSGVEWLGEVPEHWETQKLSWAFCYAKGRNAATLTKEYVADNSGDYPVFSGQTGQSGLMGMLDSYEFDFKSPVIFVTTVGARAMSTRLVVGKFSLSQNCALIIPRYISINPTFFLGVLQTLFDYERRSISLIMQPSLRFEDLNKFWVPLPTESEQTAIADFLDQATGKIDTLVTKKRALIGLLKEKRTALISRTVTRGLPPEVAREFGLEPHTRFKDSGIEWLGEVPERWEVKRIKFVFPRLYSGVSVNSDNSPADQDSFGVMKTSCVYGNRFYPEENKRVLDDEVDRLACVVTRDSLIISRMNTPDLVGNCGFVETDHLNLFLPDRLWIARFENQKKMLGKFAWYLISSDAFVKLTGALATGTSGSMKNLTQDAFLNITAAITSAEEQTAIANYLDRETAKLDGLIEKVEAVIARLQEYRTALITAAVTGKIDIREAIV
jgi:type I restriction enzyme S subunit